MEGGGGRGMAAGCVGGGVGTRPGSVQRGRARAARPFKGQKSVGGVSEGLGCINITASPCSRLGGEVGGAKTCESQAACVESTAPWTAPTALCYA